jgi:hypothetical protein
MALIDKATKKYKDPEQSRFSKTNMFFETNPLIFTQDPSAIGFKLMLDPNSPLFSLEDGNRNCAYNYLISIGETERAAYLKKFIEVFKFMLNDMPWYFQTIDGLDEAWKRDFNSPRVHGELTIGCLDDITFKMTGLIDLYRKACFDWANTREVVPHNLRKFGLMVYVHEIKMITGLDSFKPQDSLADRVGEFKKSFAEDKNAAIAGAFAKVTGQNDKSIDIQSTTRMLFHFHKCTINLESGSKIFSSLSNSDPTSGSQELKLEYHGVEEKNVYKIFGEGTIGDVVTGALDLGALDIPVGGAPFDLDAALLKVEEVATNLARGFVNNQIDSAKAKAGSIILNAIGGQSPSLANALKRITGSPTNSNNESSSLSNDTIDSSKTDGIGGPATELGVSLTNKTKSGPAGNVYE